MKHTPLDKYQGCIYLGGFLESPVEISTCRLAAETQNHLILSAKNTVAQLMKQGWAV